MEIGTADLLFLTRRPDLQGNGGATRCRIRLHLQAGKRGLRRGAGSSPGDQCLACLLQGIRQILLGDGVIDDMGRAGMLRGKTAFQPVDRIGFFHPQAVLHRDP